MDKGDNSVNGVTDSGDKKGPNWGQDDIQISNGSHRRQGVVAGTTAGTQERLKVEAEE